MQNYSNLQLQAAAATGVVSASAAAYPGHTATRLTDSYSTVGSVPSTGGTYTSLSGLFLLYFCENFHCLDIFLEPLIEFELMGDLFSCISLCVRMRTRYTLC